MSAETVQAVGFSWWKRRHVRAFLQPAAVRFVARPEHLADNRGTIAATWGMRLPPERFPAGFSVWRLEDGFLRSVGLGADLTTPLSWVKDSRGIYYDATSPSDLEDLLATRRFETREKDRAHTLQARLVFAGLTKYNVGSGTWLRPANARRVILVPGQVESDAAIRLGTNRITTNLELVKAVRAAEPDAFIVYKPHPDVTAGLRRQGPGEVAIGEWCNQVVTSADMHQLLDQVDEVHTMTSLAGFEALLRGKKVVTYGMPFYAGWGLTEDRDMLPATAQRRGRKLALEELVCGCLILYPLYADRAGRLLEGPERALDELDAWRKQGPPRFHPLRPVLRLFGN